MKLQYNKHPVTNDGRTDHRYTITKEFCGYPEARFVVRFCGDFIMQSLFYSSALARAVGHNAERRGALTITEVA